MNSGRTSVFEDAQVVRSSRDIRLRATDGKTLTIAIYPNFYPIAYRAKATKTSAVPYAGLDVDIMLAFCAHIGLVPKFKVVKSWVKTWLDVDGDLVDVGIGGISREARREKSGIEWTSGYYRVMRTIVYRLDDPILSFPKGVTGKVRGTMGSTGMDDAYNRIFKAGLDPDDIIDDPWPPKTDKADVRDLLDGKIQGLMRGSFVGRAIVAEHPKELGMMKPWNVDTGRRPQRSKAAAGADDEVFAFPCRRGSGLAAVLTAFLAHIRHSGALRKLKIKYGIQSVSSSK